MNESFWEGLLTRLTARGSHQLKMDKIKDSSLTIYTNGTMRQTVESPPRFRRQWNAENFGKISFYGKHLQFYICLLSYVKSVLYYYSLKMASGNHERSQVPSG